MAGFGSIANSAKGKITDVYQNGKLEKARVLVYKKNSDETFSVKKSVEVQFNPTEYTISRGTKMSKKHALGGTPWSVASQSVHGEPSTLHVVLYFDAYTEFQSSVGVAGAVTNPLMQGIKTKYNNHKKPDLLPNFDYNEDFSPKPNEAVNKRCREFLEMVRYSHEDHAPPRLGFVWGKNIHFVGKISSYTVQYSLFGRDGTPVRAKIDITFSGEDKSFMEKDAQYPKESPDRTKQRTLGYGDQLWMMAQEEYGDPGQWKAIASANDILNPRTMPPVATLKVPSIR